MEEVAENYHSRQYSFQLDAQMAFEWCEKACAAGGTFAMAQLGRTLLAGYLPNHEMKGMMCLSVAAGKGSSIAAHELGLALAEGKYNLPVDISAAIHWLNKSLEGSSHDTLTEEAKQETRQKLEELLNGANLASK